MSAASINTLVSAAQAAIAGGDNDTALSKLRQARVLMSGLPDSRGSMNDELTWNREQIDACIADLQKLQHADAAADSGNGFLQRTKIKYVRAT